MLERLHGILEAMLDKAAKQDFNWVQKVTFALFALRQAPNRNSA